MATKIYVELLDEGTLVWRPVEAIHLRDDLYRIAEDNAQPDGEHWAFRRDSIVRCKVKRTQEGDLILVAHEQVEESLQS